MENNSIWGLLIYCFFKINPNDACFSASFSMVFVGRTMLLFSHMGPLNFLTEPNMQHTWGEKIQEKNKMSLSLIFIYVFASKEC